MYADLYADRAAGQPSRHKCLIYDGDPSEQLPVVTPLLLDGLEDNWRCLYLGSPDAVHLVESALGVRGVDTAREVSRGALVLSSDRSHLVDGTFDPDMMVDGLCAAIDDALRDGFGGLCATGDMRWELGDDDRNFELLVEYEAKLERLFRDRPLRGICQYHRDLVPAQAIRAALVTHRSTYLGDAVNHDNLFYLPPELLLDGAAAQQGEWMYQQITRILAAERRRDEALRALDEVNRDLERRVAERTAELRTANQHLDAFASSVSHDLRNPLNALIGFGELLADDCGPSLGDRGRLYLERMRQSARHMNELIEGMLELGRIVKADLDRGDVDLSALADEIVRDLRDANPERRVEVVVGPGLRARGDAVLLRAVLTNLLSNAWKFTSRQSAARVELGRVADEQGAFFVRDNGAGFDMLLAPRLFGIFQRLHSQEQFPGTGVGLATVARIIERHGGRIWAEARPGEGATFFFTLP